MSKILSLLLILVVTFGMLVQDANAKRFGGGRSFGVSRSASSFARPSAIPTGIPTQQRSTASKWLGPLAGFAAGGLLASMFMGHGGGMFGGGILSWILIAFAGYFILNLFRRGMSASAPAPAQYNSASNVLHDTVSRFTQHGAGSVDTGLNSSPAGFDTPGFLRDAKVLFIRLQAAYDAKNLNDIREFAAPEVYAEVQLQFQERGDVANHTEVVTLDAQLLDAVHEPQGMLASVQFSGMIREDQNPVAAFREIWHFRKEDSSLKWVVAGIQQQ